MIVLFIARGPTTTPPTPPDDTSLPIGPLRVFYELNLQGVGWTDVTEDVFNDVTWRRGINGKSPTDCVSSPGTFRFTLRNDGQNGKPIGYYSPDHAQCRTGFTYGIEARTGYEYETVRYVKWTGTLTSILPTPNQHATPFTSCIAESKAGQLLAKVRSISPQILKTEVENLVAIRDALSPTARPIFLYDAPLHTFKVALDNVGSGIQALTAIRDVVQSARGVFIERGDGQMLYRNRIMRALTLISYDFTDAHFGPQPGIARPASQGSAYNIARVQTHDKTFGATNTEVLFSHQGTLSVEPAQSLDFWATYRDPVNAQQAIAGYDFFNGGVLVAGTDYEFNAAEDGSGADLTSQVAVTVTPFTTTALFTITNNSGVTAYRRKLQLRGRSIKDLNPVWSEASLPATYDNAVEIDLRYQHDTAFARDEAQHIAASYFELSNIIDSMTFMAVRDVGLLLRMLMLEVGDVVRISETATGTSQVSNYIQWIEHTISADGPNGPMVMVKMGLAPRIEKEVRSDDAVTWDDADSLSSVVPETRVDVALVDQSEAA